MLPPVTEEYLAVILKVAAADRSIAAALREICALDASVRHGALDVVGAHLRSRDAQRDVLECVDALRRDDVARLIAERLPRA
jgi:hypothetical protein